MLLTLFKCRSLAEKRIVLMLRIRANSIHMNSIQPIFRHVCLIAICFLLSSCAATGPRFSGPSAPEPGKADVYVYRVSKFQAVLKPYDVLLDGQKVGSLVNSSYMKITVSPGAHNLTLVPAYAEWAEQRVSMSVRAQPDSTIYLRINLGMTTTGALVKGSGTGVTLWNSNNSLSSVPEAAALTELADLNAVQ